MAAPCIFLYPAIIGAFTGITIKIFITPLGGIPVDIDQDHHDAHLLVFSTGNNVYNMFLNSGDTNVIIESMSSGSGMAPPEIQVSNQDALTWTISLPEMIQYRVTFRDECASNRFAILASLWRRATGEGGINNELQEHVVLRLAGDRWGDDVSALAEIDMLTSTFALMRPEAQ